jgi:2-C-methyl-D-erythritol 4-phosphate cytidylyltransferase
MLGQLGIEYSELGEQRSSARLFNAFQRDPQNRHLLALLKALDEYNQQGTIITDEASLAARITPILT